MGFFIKLLLTGLALLMLNSKIFAQSFLLSSLPVVGTNPILVAAADVNSDGKMDLISLSNTTGFLTVLTNNGSGGFGSNATIKAGMTGLFANSFTAADINGDGKVDLVCAMTTGNPYYIGVLSMLTNNGGGIFVSNAFMSVGTNPVSVAVADVNGDGKVDLISANTGGLPNYHTLSVLTNNGNGIFGSNATLNVGSGVQKVIAADVNGDGKVDLISVNFYVNTLSILTNNGSGLFILAASPSTGANPLSVVSADVNGDGRMDLISANTGTVGDSTLSIFTNNGSGSFTVSSSPSVGPTPYAVAAADVNGDGSVDLICPSAPANNLTVLTNNGSGSFVIAASPAVGSKPFSVTTADVNGDGRLDLISANTFTNTLSILTNTSTFLPRVALKRSGNNAVVSWPSQWTGWAGWTLQQNTNLNTASWTSFSGIIGDDGTTKTVTNSAPTGNFFFRLSHP